MFNTYKYAWEHPKYWEYPTMTAPEPACNGNDHIIVWSCGGTDEIPFNGLECQCGKRRVREYTDEKGEINWDFVPNV